MTEVELPVPYPIVPLEETDQCFNSACGLNGHDNGVKDEAEEKLYDGTDKVQTEKVEENVENVAIDVTKKESLVEETRAGQTDADIVEVDLQGSVNVLDENVSEKTLPEIDVIENGENDDGSSEDDAPLSNLVTSGKITPTKVNFEADIPAPSAVPRLETPFPMDYIRGRRGLREDLDNSVRVRSAPATPGELVFPPLWKSHGQNDLLLVGETRKRRRIDDEFVTNPLPKKRKDNWLHWANPIRWFVGRQCETETAEVVEEQVLDDITEEDAKLQDVQDEQFVEAADEDESRIERRLCTIM